MRDEFAEAARVALLTRREWAALYRVPVATVAQWLLRYPNPPQPIIGPPRTRTPLWWHTDVEAWMRAHELPGGITRPDARDRLARR